VRYSLIFSNYTTLRTCKEKGHHPYLSCKAPKNLTNIKGETARTDIY